MGDLSKDTEIEGADGRYSARLSEEWEIWGPQGGYVATVALRAAGAHSVFDKPVSLLCHYVNVAEFGDVQIEVETLRRSRRAESIRAQLKQGGKPILEALVWTVADLKGFDHLDARMPDVPAPQEIKSWAEWYPDEDGPPFRFWNNLEGRPVGFDKAREKEAGPPHTQTWMRFSSRPTFDDPFVDAGRLVIVGDVMMFPSAVRIYGGGGPPPYVAPSMDLAISFHQFAPESEYLLVDATSPIATASLVGGRTSVWSQDGHLLATGIQQMLQRL